MRPAVPGGAAVRLAPAGGASARFPRAQGARRPLLICLVSMAVYENAPGPGHTWFLSSWSSLSHYKEAKEIAGK